MMARGVQIDKDRLFTRIEEAELFSKHFGSFTKSDYEVLMFTVFLDSMEDEVRDYDISIALGITESKVRTLRVKSQLLYPRELKWVEQLTSALDHGFYVDGMITITLENPSVRNMIRNEVESKYGTVNISLNSKQLVLPVESYLLLAACAEKDTDTVLQELNKRFIKDKEIIGGIQKEKFKARIFKNVNNVAEAIQNVIALFTYGRPIIEAVIRLIG